MTISAMIAQQFRQVHFGGNWTSVNVKDTLLGVSWQQATTKIREFNTIAALVYHMNYYVSAVLKVLQGQPLQAHDKYSYDVPAIQSAGDWEQLLQKTWNDAVQFAALVETFPDSRLVEELADPKYGNYYRNFQGIIEHCHYHLGQVVIIKKLLS